MRANHENDYVEYVTARLPALHRAAYLLCGDAHRADDIVQATATALYRHWRRARAADSLDAYVHRMLVRKYLDETRSGWARVRLLAGTPEPAGRPDGGARDHGGSGIEERDSLRTALAKLPNSQRTVLVLRFACDMSVEDVAAALRCSAGNVKSHTSRGLAALRRVLGAEHTFTPEQRGARP
jgi:RNA polymerase sigma-70 factor (sigma-E family)